MLPLAKRKKYQTQAPPQAPSSIIIFIQSQQTKFRNEGNWISENDALPNEGHLDVLKKQSPQSVDNRFKIWQRHVWQGIMRDFSVMCLNRYEWHYLNIQTNKVKYSNKEPEAIWDENDYLFI